MRMRLISNYIWILLCFLVVLMSSCSIFRKNSGYGCPRGGAAIGAERILTEKGALKKSQKTKFRVKNTINKR